MAERNGNGQFAKGRSGNPRGRPPKRQMTHRTPAGYRVTMLEVGHEPVTIFDKETGETRTMTLLEANIRALARRGGSGHTPATKAFLDRYFEAAGVHGELTQLHRYLMSENARLELEVEALKARLPNLQGGVVTVPEEEWRRRTAAKELAWQTRDVDVNPPPGVR